MMQQTPVPPMPPMPPMDAMTLGVPGSILFIILVSVVAATVILWPIVRALARRLEGKGTATPG